MRSLTNLKQNEMIKAILILGTVITVAYFPIFLNHTYNPAYTTARFPITDFARDYGCHADCTGPFNFTIDPGADADAIWPVMQLATNLYLHGIIPLWNPYLGGGTPLAADTVNFVFSPLMVLHLLPNSLWDISLLISIWLAGIFTYFLLRLWNLGFLSSITGSIIFMFSGAITWYLPHDSILVIIFTPLVLFSIEKIFQSKNFNYILLGSVSVAFAALGGHLESIVLLLLFSMMYFVFRILYTFFSKYEKNIHAQTNNIVLTQNGKKIFLKTVVIFSAGLSLSAFFILPVVEYVLIYGNTSHDVSVGLAHNPVFTIASTFVPYIMGPVQVYILPTSFTGSWNSLGGYVAASTLFFSLIGMIFSNTSFLSNLHKRIAQFFFFSATFFILKSIGVPIINELGILPILNQIVFPRYDGFIWTLGLAISAAFGIEVLIQRKLNTRNLLPVLIISFLIIILASLLIIPYFTWGNLTGQYVVFQILQSLFFILIAFLLVISTKYNAETIIGVFCLFLLELSLYIPMGVPPIWQFYRSIVVILAATMICLVNFIPAEKLPCYFIGKNKIKLKIFVIIILLATIGQLIVYLESPQGLRIRNNAFPETSVTMFLKNNIGNSRIFSLDSAFISDNPAAYEIQTIGIMSAQNINSFNTFVRNFLDPYSTYTVFDYVDNWRLPDSPPIHDVFLKNEKYYDFLGIKYIVSNTTNPNNFMFGPLGADGNTPIGSTANSIVQQFRSPMSSITSISVQLGTYNQQNQGKVVLTLDSIPYDKVYHRQSIVNAQDVVDGAFQEFQLQPLDNIQDKLFTLNLKFLPTDSKSAVAVFYYNGHQSPPSLDVIKNLVGGTFTINNSTSNGILAFSVNSARFSLAFKSDNLVVYENPHVFPRVFLVNKYQVTNSYINAQNIIKDPNFDLRHEVVIEGNLTADQSHLLQSYADSSSSAEITSYSANKVTVHTHSNGASMLILTDTYYPGWHAIIDGVETHIYRADGLVRTIFVPEGAHTIEFSYMPQSFVIGMEISLSTVAVLVGILLYSKRREKMRLNT